MSSLQIYQLKPPTRSAAWLIALCWLGLHSAIPAQENAPLGPESDLRALSKEDYAALTTNSPFLRAIAPSNSLVLTGFARIDGEVVATVVDTTLRETHVVTPTVNAKGWTLVEMQGEGSSPDELRARIQIGQGEVVTIRYSNAAEIHRQNRRMGSVKVAGKTGTARPLSREQLSEAKHAAINYREGYSADGYPDEPPRDMQRKLSQLSVQQRESINREMLQLRNQGLGPAPRLKIYQQKVDSALGGQRR